MTFGSLNHRFYMVSNSKNIDLNDKGCVDPTSLIIKSTCLIICFSFFFYKVSIKNRFLYKMFFFLLHLLQVQQHMMAITMMRTVMKMIKTTLWRMVATYLTCRREGRHTEPYLSHLSDTLTEWVLLWKHVWPAWVNLAPSGGSVSVDKLNIRDLKRHPGEFL